MRHLLSLLALVAVGFTANAQGTVTATNLTGQIWSEVGFEYLDGDVLRAAAGRLGLAKDGSGLQVASWELFWFNNPGFRAWVANDDYASSLAWSGAAPASGNYSFGIAAPAFELGEYQIADWPALAVPEPNTNVFFLMGLTLLLLSNRCQSGPWWRSPGLSVQPQRSSPSATSAAH